MSKLWFISYKQLTKYYVLFHRTTWNLEKFLPKSVTSSPLFKRKDLKIWLNKIFDWTCQNQISTEDIKLEFLKTLKSLIKTFDNFVYHVKLDVIRFFIFTFFLNLGLIFFRTRKKKAE